MADQAKWVWGIVLHRYIKRTPWLKEQANNDKDLSLSAPGGNCFFPPLSSKCSELSVPLLPFEGGVLLNVEVLSAGLRQAQKKKKNCPKKEFFQETEREIPAHLILSSQRICQIQAYPITNVWLVFTYFIGKFVQVPTIQLKKQSPEKVLLIFVPSA